MSTGSHCGSQWASDGLGPWARLLGILACCCCLAGALGLTTLASEGHCMRILLSIGWQSRQPRHQEPRP